MFALVDDKGARRSLNGRGPWVVGRHQDSDIVFADDPYCARRQLEIELAGNDLWLTPLAQNTATYLNGQPVSGRVRVGPGQEIRFGGTVVRIAAGGGSATYDDDERSIAIAGKATVIGRVPGNGVFSIDHPTVSRRHAEFGKSGKGAWIRDLQSTNGTYVNGKRISGRVTLKEGDVVTIGPGRFVLQHGELAVPQEQRHAAPGGAVAIRATALAFDVGAERKRILHPCNVAIRKGEFVCLIGGSGAGKSTMMNLLAGRRIPSEGKIEMMGADLAREFDSLKPFMAYVPQREVLHSLLTVRAALGYIAEMRLPSDMSAADRRREVEAAAAAVEMTPHLDKAFKMLSGGQKKRACLAAEILCKPQVLFLDEVTSGLDEQTDFEIMQLLGKLAKQGMTICCVTHTLANIVQFCDRVIVMGTGGYLAFSGAPADALKFFGIERLGEVFLKVTGQTAPGYAERFRREHGSGRGEEQSSPRPWASNDNRPDAIRRFFIGLSQFGVLMRRNFALLIADKPTLMLVFLQAAIIGIFVGWAMSDFGSDFLKVNSQKVLLTLMVMSAIWMGCNGSSKDIVGEADILKQEKAVNLSLVAYLAARIVTAFIFVSVQVLVMFALVSVLSDGIPGDLVSQAALLCLAGCIAVLLGLLISAAAKSDAQATAIVPMLLVPQLIFIGTIVPNMPEFLDDIASKVVPTNVLNAAMLAVFDRDDGPIKQIRMTPSDPEFMSTQPLDDTLWLTLIHFGVLVLATYLVLRWRYRRGAGD